MSKEMREQINKIKNFGEFNSKINIDDIKIEREMVLVDTSDVNNIIRISKEGKMPLDKLRVETMVSILLSGSNKLPPIKLDKSNLLIDGHHRYMAYKISDIEEIPFEYIK
jgi:hypothetical protein